MSVLQETVGKLGIAGELLAFLWRRKLWWMMPMVLILVFVGLLIVVGSSTGAGPFIYTLF